LPGKKEKIQPLLINNKHAIILLFCLILATIIHVKIPYAIDGYRFLFLFFILFASTVIIYHFADKNIRKFVLSDKDLFFCLLLTAAATFIVRISTVLLAQFTPEHAQDLFYLIPLFTFGMIMRVVLFSEAVLIFSTILGAAVAFMLGNDLSVFLYVFLGNVLAAYFTGTCEKRTVILKAGFYTAVIMAFLVVMLHSLLGYPIASIPIRIGAILFAGVGSSFITLGLLPVVEHLFDYATDIKLLELANLEHPLLGEMMIKAPGTYHHSIIVGNLSKAAAESIGAHPILTRVAAYYHDIGKLKMPHYYIENRTTLEDAHGGLSPHMSALIILAHVKEGIDLAVRYRLGKQVQEMIKQHHGTTLVNRFYIRAKEQEDPQVYAVQEIDFRYMGPKPQTKEAGILMLADAVEAASRNLEEPTPKRIETLVQQVVEKIFADGQLDDCELMLKDLRAIQKSFTAILLGIFHHRTEYPERMENGGFDKRFPRIVPSGQATGAKGDRRLINLFGPRE
jgi:putative nucleotidyltransferase with HDIG domain